MGSLTINLLGTSFKINARQDEQYLQQIMSYYTEVVESLKKSFPGQDSLQTAILAGIMISDELYSQKYSTESGIVEPHEQTELMGQIENITTKMIESINKVL